uniref:DDT domain-containing protein n=1 Tax=Caenorhabditis japonica TaxID=281687 RepID=A0A8R1I3N9_CAEJA
MAPRGRPRRRSESGTSVPETDLDTTESTQSSSTRPRRSRLPKRYFDEDYSPPAAKRRAPQNRSSPSETGDDEEEIKLTIRLATPRAVKATGPAATPKSTPKPRGRPKRSTPATANRGRRQSKKVEEVIYMDEDDSEEAESSDDEEFLMPPDEQEEIEEELELENIKMIKEEEEESYCPWFDADPDTLPKLELPESSQDISLPNHATFDAIEIYEILRSYHRTLRITPFTFEDFCAALISRNNSCIMAEIHMALLRIGLKSDDEEQTHYSVTDTNNAINIMLHHLDTLTYAEVLRQYIEAYPFADESVRDAINTDNYPYCGYEAKIVVLLFMCYRFLYSSEYKKVVNNVGKFQNDDNCRVCGKSSGQIVGCTQCEAAFHVECSRLNPFPEVLVCNICTSNNVRGVANALPLGESVDREPLRSQPIGRDRYGRYYWFVVRRLVVQSLDDSEVHYYSTPPQLFQILQKLDRNYYEKALCGVIQERIDEILEQMTLTVEMATERRDTAIEAAMKKNSMSYEYMEAITPQLYLHKDNMKRMSAILRDCAEKVRVKSEVKEEGEEVEDEEATRSSGPLEVKTLEDAVLPESMIGIYDGRLINTFWSGGATQEELVAYYLTKLDEKIDAMSYWRLGDEMNDQTFMTYHNWYMKNEMAESTTTRKKAADKKKYMASRYSTIENFDWITAKDRKFYGNSVLHNKFVGWSLANIARKIPTELMHRKWPEVVKSFEAELVEADDYHKLAKCLLKLDAALRKTVFIAQWWSGLGQTKMERSTVEKRENLVKEQQKIKKMELDAVAKDLDESFVRVNYTKSKWPNTYILRQKGETYRNASRGGMGGWMWIANKYEKRIVQVPERPKLPLAVNEDDQKTEPIANHKARHLELLVSKIRKRRTQKTSSEPEIANFLLINKCYSPSCQTRDSAIQQSSCYSPSCRSGYLSWVRQRYEEQELEKKQVLGEGKPWPIPEIQTFSTRKDGKKSIFVLQKKILRRMIATAGCLQIYIPGFMQSAKSNYLIWPYPAPRPTLDLCWKWQTLNARSIHAVALQLKIMWSSIKWNEFDPEDSHPDRRVVVDTPSHDERRRIIQHKEMAPYGQYERYELEIEIIPLYDENEEEDESWSARRERVDVARSATARRIKRPNRGPDNRVATAIRKEWVDGVTLKVFEIRDYWKDVRAEIEKTAKRKAEALRKAAKAREDAEKAAIQALAARQQKPVPMVRSSSERINVPYVEPIPSNGSPIGNGQGRYLEKYNNSQLPPRNGPNPLPVSVSSSRPPQPYQHQPTPKPRHVQTNSLIRKGPVSAYTPYCTSSQPSTSRAAAGADHPSNYRHASRHPGQHYPQHPRASYHQQQQQQQQQMRVMSNGYHFPEGTVRGGGRPAHGMSRPRAIQQNVILQPFGEPQASDMRRAMPVGEEAVAANAASDGDEMPPVIPRYDRNTPVGSDQQSQQPRSQHQVFNIAGGPQMMRAVPAGGGAGAKNVIYVKGADGAAKVMVRQALPGQGPSSAGPQQDYPPGTVIPGARVMTMRPTGQTQHMRQVFTAGSAGPRFVRIQNAQGTPRPTSDQIVRRAMPAQRQLEYDDQVTSQMSQPTRYVIQGNPVPVKIPRVVPRGGMTMQMVQQQQHPDPMLDNQMVEQEPMIHESTGFAVAQKEEEQ